MKATKGINPKTQHAVHNFKDRVAAGQLPGQMLPTSSMAPSSGVGASTPQVPMTAIQDPGAPVIDI